MQVVAIYRLLQKLKWTSEIIIFLSLKTGGYLIEDNHWQVLTVVSVPCTFQVPFIAFYRKEYVEPDLMMNDLWKVWAWDEKVGSLKHQTLWLLISVIIHPQSMLKRSIRISCFWLAFMAEFVRKIMCISLSFDRVEWSLIHCQYQGVDDTFLWDSFHCWQRCMPVCVCGKCVAEVYIHIQQWL